MDQIAQFVLMLLAIVSIDLVALIVLDKVLWNGQLFKPRNRR